MHFSYITLTRQTFRVLVTHGWEGFPAGWWVFPAGKTYVISFPDRDNLPGAQPIGEVDERQTRRTVHKLTQAPINYQNFQVYRPLRPSLKLPFLLPLQLPDVDGCWLLLGCGSRPRGWS